MMAAVQTVHDHARGCGWRKPGGLYLRSLGEGFDCGRLPIPFVTCPCCGFGIRPSRQPTWVDGDQLLMALPSECKHEAEGRCEICPLGKIEYGEFGQALLIWIGESYYPTVDRFNREAAELGVSRRIQSVPHGFEVGKTWVLLAHPKGILRPIEFGKEPEWEPAIFRVFRPNAIEYVVTGKESDDDLDRMVKRGITPVEVIREEGPVQNPMPEEGVA